MGVPYFFYNQKSTFPINGFSVSKHEFSRAAREINKRVGGIYESVIPNLVAQIGIDLGRYGYHCESPIKTD